MMTSRQRIEAALSHRTPDRTPVFEYVLQPPLADIFLGRECLCAGERWSSAVAQMGWEGAVRQTAVDQIDLAERLGHDMMCVVPNPPPSGQVPGPFAGWSSDGDDPVANIKRRNQQRSAGRDEMPDECFLVYACLKEEMIRRDVDLPILAPAYTHGVWDDVDLMQTMLLDPDVAHEHFALATQCAFRSIDKYIELGVDQIGVGGDFAGKRLLISPDAYRRFIVPQVRACSRRIHQAGRYAVNASDGDLWTVIEDFLLECEVDGYLEIDLRAGMDLPRLKRAYGGRITFYGNLDCGNTLSFASPAEVAAYTRQCLEDGSGDGGHILCASNAITASVPLANYLAVVNTYREIFSLEKLSV